VLEATEVAFEEVADCTDQTDDVPEDIDATEGVGEYG